MLHSAPPILMQPAYLLLALVLTTTARATEAEPAPLPAERYAAMAGKSPFALATAIAPPTAPAASFAANWFVSGIGRLGDTDFVTIKSRDASIQFSLFGNEPNPQYGVAMASVNWSETIGKSTVVLQKGTEIARLEFNEAELRGPTPAPDPAAAAKNATSVRTGGAPPVAGLRSGEVPSPVITPPRMVQQFPGSKPGEIRRRERPIPVPK